MGYRFPLLAEGRAIVVVHCRQKLFGFLAQLAGRIGNASDYCPGLGFEHLQGEIDLAKLVAAAAVENLAQRIVGDIPGVFGQGRRGGRRLKRNTPPSSKLDSVMEKAAWLQDNAPNKPRAAKHSRFTPVLASTRRMPTDSRDIRRQLVFSTTTQLCIEMFSCFHQRFGR
ncbi:hypothetical protein PPS11_19874 [Pseudomonas putida S11]|nr:hypothetical protein PPS11_19874 [Pseudomonas putida S11]